MSRGTSPEQARDSNALDDYARALQAIYRHWEHHQWSPFAIDFTTDASSYAALDEQTRDMLMWILAQRFQAEFQVARLLGPFLTAAPDYHTALVLATQVADEFRHVQAVLRVYEELVGIKGGIASVQPLADAYMDPVAATLYEALDSVVGALATSHDADTFLRAVFGYHVIGEGVVGRTTQRILPDRLRRFGAFPGLIEAQRLAARDETRHVGFGVTYVRRCVAEDRDHAWSVFGYVVEGFRTMCTELLETADAALDERFVTTYGLEPEQLWEKTMSTLRVRLQSVGLGDV